LLIRESPFKSRSGWSRLVNALRYSSAGLAQAWRCEAAFRQEIYALSPLALLAALAPVSTLATIASISLLVLVLITELLNSAIEAVVDRIGTEAHPLSGRAKDFGSAAVFLSVLLAVGAWIALIGLPLAHKYLLP
jgi:diacylglycerol kinase (ATP)